MESLKNQKNKKNHYIRQHKIFDCVNEENEQTFSITKSQAKRKKIKKFKLKYTGNSSSPNCHTLPHNTPVKAEAVLTTVNRNKNNITLSVCGNCAKIIADALTYVFTYKKTYIDKEKGIIIKYKKHMYPDQRCTFCGKKNSKCYDIHLGKCHYLLCPNCEMRQYKQFLAIDMASGKKDDMIKSYRGEATMESDAKLYKKYNLNPEKYNNISIEDVGFSSRISNALTRNNINYVSDLLKSCIGDIKRIRNIGVLSISQIEEYVSALQ